MFYANSADPDQIPHSLASDLGLQCLPITLLGVTRLKWVNLSTMATSLQQKIYGPPNNGCHKEVVLYVPRMPFRFTWLIFMVIDNKVLLYKKKKKKKKNVIAPDNMGYQATIFLISPQKGMLWILTKSALISFKHLQQTEINRSCNKTTEHLF